MATSTSIARSCARWICATNTARLGDDLIAAGVAGYQVMGRLGQALITKDLARVFRPTGLIGAIGAAAAGARLLCLTEEETASALSLAANTAGGLNEWPHVGGDEMVFHAG